MPILPTVISHLQVWISDVWYNDLIGRKTRTTESAATSHGVG